MTLGEGLKRFRQLRGITQQQAADAAKIRKQNYYRYEHNLASPNSSVLIKISKAFDVSLDYLVGLSDNPTRS